MRKLLLACVREAKAVLLLDNAKGHLSSEALEAFVQARSGQTANLAFPKL